MSDLISRQAAIDAVAKLLAERCGGNVTWWKPVAKFVIDDLSSAEPKRKTGRWIEDSDPGETPEEHWACSECHMCYGHMNANVLFHYCPHCGAKMEVEHEHPD